MEGRGKAASSREIRRDEWKAGRGRKGEVAIRQRKGRKKGGCRVSGKKRQGKKKE